MTDIMIIDIMIKWTNETITSVNPDNQMLRKFITNASPVDIHDWMNLNNINGTIIHEDQPIHCAHRYIIESPKLVALFQLRFM